MGAGAKSPDFIAQPERECRYVSRQGAGNHRQPHFTNGCYPLSANGTEGFARADGSVRIGSRICQQPDRSPYHTYSEWYRPDAVSVSAAYTCEFAKNYSVHWAA